METFTQTSDVPYDRHTYEIHFVDKKKSPLKFEYLDDAKQYWFSHSHFPNFLKYITIIDKIEKKKKTGGFGG